MSSLAYLLTIFWIFLLVLMIYLSAAHLVKLRRTGAFSLRPLFKGFGQKMWMTIGLGIMFFGLYYLVITLASRFFDSNQKLNLLMLARQHPAEFIYMGLGIFSCVTISIYIVRIMIKNIYNMR